MPMIPIVECIPNFSEGRRIDVVDAIYESLARVEGVAMLHRTSDADHNRSVITFAGEPQVVVEGAFAGIKTASQLIDMVKHQGVHPRIGATDVVPFVPIQGVTMDDCVQLSHQLGKRVADELQIPVYLYEHAATKPERRNLADIRRGEYETLKETIASDTSRQPDYGDAKIGKAGAVAIGARQPLIAYNVYLSTDDVTIAQHIAKKIRFSSGGLPYVKALGFLVDGQAQVSMNLTDYTQTSIYQVMEAIWLEAQTYNVAVERSELIGLIPQQALFNVATSYLQLDDVTLQDVLEIRLQSRLKSR